MELPNNHPFLLFEFAEQNGIKTPICFTDPIKIITTMKVEEVVSCLLQVEEEISIGHYAAGFLSYEAAPAFDHSFQVHTGGKMPLLWFGIFKEPNPFEPKENENFSISKWSPAINGEQYHQEIAKIKEAIKNGDTYQINYTTRLHADFHGDDFAYYKKGASAQDSDYCAYLNIGDYQILSASPELFFRWDGEKIITRPMKGTINRGMTFEEDGENAKWLYHSEKNRAENVMIVDLLRNDLGAIAIPGTVNVDELFSIEKYPTVWQMTSTISANTEKEVGIVDIFKALFPCGSITGAPKISTMKFIANLEDSPRDVYCGAVGYISPQKDAVFNVPIRTVLINRKTHQAVYGVGGGITWDSTTKDEYEEIVMKAALLTRDNPLFDLLESLKLENGTYFLFNLHMHRLKKTAQYFNFNISIDDIMNGLSDFAKKNENQCLKVRLLVSKNGKYNIVGEPIVPFEHSLKVKLGTEPINMNNPFLYHKTTNRQVYQSYKLSHPDVFDILLWNQKGEITEFTNGNIVVEKDGKLYTPPIHSGLLAGTFREQLLKTNIIQEKIVTIQEIKTFTKIWFINSVRGWVKVQFVD